MPRIRHHCPEPGCNAILSTRNVLKVHHLTHTGERPFACGECDRSFATQSTLTTHVRTHSGEKPYVCSEAGCHGSFSTSSSLKKHQRVAHVGDRPFPCLQCDYAAKERKRLKEHMKIHDATRLMPCTVEGCTEAFLTQQSLTKHIRGHLGTKPFRCTEEGCDARYATNDCLRQHHCWAHGAERPFGCNLCSKRFPSSSSLTNHIKTHTGERNYACPDENCGDTFVLRGNMQTHWRTQHSEEGQKRQKKQELRVASAFQLAGISYKAEHHVNFDCLGLTFARTDFMIIMHGGVLIVEVDEHQHFQYPLECELARMSKIHTAFMLDGNTLPVAFVRYNSDVYKIDGKVRHTRKKHREAKLIDVIQQWKFGPPSSLQIMYMYYDASTSVSGLTLDIWEESGYNGNMRACCVEPIV